MIAPVVETANLKYIFSGDELVELARLQSRKIGERDEVEEQHKQMREDFKGKLSAIEGEINATARRVSAGYEMRSVKTLILKRRPSVDEKIVVRLDLGIVTDRKRLQADERQMEIVDEDYSHVAELVMEDGGEIVRAAVYSAEAQILADAGVLVTKIEDNRAIEARAEAA